MILVPSDEDLLFAYRDNSVPDGQSVQRQVLASVNKPQSCKHVRNAHYANCELSQVSSYCMAPCSQIHAIWYADISIPKLVVVTCLRPMAKGSTIQGSGVQGSGVEIEPQFVGIHRTGPLK